MKTFTSSKQRLGELGETIACRFLKRRGFTIIERNYTQKWGEIDIVAIQGVITHFIEVKSVSCENIFGSADAGDAHRPEDQVHPRKLARISRTLRTYLSAHPEVGEWSFDVICVYINQAKKFARVKIMLDLTL
jgi:putative endonuclease